MEQAPELDVAPNKRFTTKRDDGSTSSHSADSEEGLLPDGEPQVRSYWDSVKLAFFEAFDETYPPDGVDMVGKKHNGIRFNSRKQADASKLSALEEYREDWFTRLTSFLGLPTRRLNDNKLDSFPDNAQSGWNIFYNYMGWRDYAPRWKNALRTLLLPINILLTVLRLSLNVVKVVTQLLPDFLNRFFKYSGDQASNASGVAKDKGKTVARHFYNVLWAGAQPFRLAFYLLHYMGEALTSPIEHFRKAIRVKKSVSVRKSETDYWRRAKQVFFGGLAIASSVAMYILTAPVAAYLLKAYVAPIIAHHVPQFMVNAYTWVADKIGPAVTKFGSWLVENPAVAWVTHHVGLSTVYSTTTPAASVGAAFGVFITTIGTAVNRAFENYFKPWWHKPSQAEKRDPDAARLDNIYLVNVVSDRFSSKKSSGIYSRANREPQSPVAPPYPNSSAYLQTDDPNATNTHVSTFTEPQRKAVNASRVATDIQGWRDVKNAAGSMPTGLSLSKTKGGPLADTSTVVKEVVKDKSADNQENRSKVGYN